MRHATARWQTRGFALRSAYAAGCVLATVVLLPAFDGILRDVLARPAPFVLALLLLGTGAHLVAPGLYNLAARGRGVASAITGLGAHWVLHVAALYGGAALVGGVGLAQNLIVGWEHTALNVALAILVVPVLTFPGILFGALAPVAAARWRRAQLKNERTA